MEDPRSRVTRTLSSGLAVGLIALAAASVLGCFGAAWWVFDLAANFRVHYLLAALAGLAAAGLLRRRWLALAAGVLALGNAALVVPWLGAPAGELRAADDILRVVSCNVRSGNPRVDACAQAVAALSPDLLCVFECSAEDVEAFVAALPGHACVQEPRDDPSGIAVLTRLPIVDVAVRAFGPQWIPAIELRLAHGDRTLSAAIVHPPPPVNGMLSRARDEVLTEVGAWARRRVEPTLVVGDLNATPWSAAMRRILADRTLTPLPGSALRGTYRASWGPLALPIDHVLASREWIATHARTAPGPGSDHRLLVADLWLGPGGPEPRSR